jgi:hypothetical protein
VIYVLMTEGMDWKQRGEMDETLEGFDKRTSRQRRLEWAQSLAGGEVLMAKR